jgi:hypothetical protein
MATTHYTSRPLLASDAAHVARIDAMQSENPMGAEQIRKMVSRQHIGGLVVENSEGVIVAWCMHIRCNNILDVLRFQRHIEFDNTTPLHMLCDYIKGRTSAKAIVCTRWQDWQVHSVLQNECFQHNNDESQPPNFIMEYTP